jgi:SAM-dependent methyltransferase
MKYDLDLFIQLNREFESKPIVPQPRLRHPADIAKRGEKRAKHLKQMFGIGNSRVLEIGCGRAEIAYALASRYGCTVVGVDIKRYSEWDTHRHPHVDLRVLDITREDYSELGQFDFIYSLAVWEHIRHPFSALQAAKNLLTEKGRMYISANLYRGPKASHRYREVYFPWPHLLFSDAVFEEYYQHIGRKPSRPTWVNKLTAAEYHVYFDLVGFALEHEWYSISPIDEAFYQRFSDVLFRYPRFDLERDFIHAVLRHQTTMPEPRLPLTARRTFLRIGSFAFWVRNWLRRLRP